MSIKKKFDMIFFLLRIVAKHWGNICQTVPHYINSYSAIKKNSMIN